MPCQSFVVLLHSTVLAKELVESGNKVARPAQNNQPLCAGVQPVDAQQGGL